MSKLLIVILSTVIIFGSLVPEAPAQEGTAERIGEEIDRGLGRIGEKLKRTWADIRKSVDELSMQGRVYARLRWDKALAGQTIEVKVQKNDVVILTGVVPDEVAKDKAVQLAQDTIGVREVVNELRIEPRAELQLSSPKNEPRR